MQRLQLALLGPMARSGYSAPKREAVTSLVVDAETRFVLQPWRFTSLGVDRPHWPRVCHCVEGSRSVCDMRP